MSQRSKKNRQKRNYQNRSETRNSTSAAKKRKNPFEEYGVEFEYVNFDPDDEKFRGYKKVKGDEAARLFSFFQYIPGMAAGETIRRTAEGASKRMLDGAYKVLIKDGMHLAKSKATEGAFRGTLLSDANNVIAGQAEMLPIEQIKLSRTPQLVLSTFNAISIATGQYYLSQINSRLTAIEEHVADVLVFLEEDKKSKQMASAITLRHYFEHIEGLKCNQELRAASLNDIQIMRREGLANILFYSSSIKRVRESLGNKSKKEVIEEGIKKVSRLFPEYWLSLFVFAKASLLELLLSDMDDPSYIVSVYEEQKRYNSEYNEEFERCKSVLNSLLDSAEDLRINLIDLLPGALVSAGSYLIPGYGKYIGSAAAAVTAGVGIAGYEKKEEKKKELTDKVQQFAAACGDTEPIEELIIETGKRFLFQVKPLEMYITENTVYFDSIDEHHHEEKEKED